MLESAKAALAAAATSIKSALPTIAAVTTATVVTSSCIYYYTIQDGIYEKRNDNVRYVLEQYISDITVDSIVENERGGYAYTTNLDEMIDEILTKLKDANSNISSYTGSGNEKEVINKLIRAELITQYPDLRSSTEIKNGDKIPENELQGGIKIVRSNSSVEVASVDSDNISEYNLKDSQVLTYKPYNEFKKLMKSQNTSVKNYYSIKSSSLSSSIIGDFNVKTDSKNAAPVLTKEQLEKAIKSKYTGEAQTNLLNELDTFISIQENYKVNAVFAIAVAEDSSLCGTSWVNYTSDTYNWLGVKDESINKYTSFKDATEKFGQLISGATYFVDDKYTVSSIASIYSDSDWGNRINENIAQIYNSVGEEINISNQVNSTTENNTNNSIDIVVAGWTEENTVINTVTYVPNNTGTEEIKTEDKQDSGIKYTFNEVSINYQNMLSKYSMPAGFLWSLLVMGEDVNLVLNLADLAIENTNIVIEAQDSNSLTVNEDVKKYIHKKDITKTIIAKDTTSKTKDYSFEAQNESEITTTVTTIRSNTRLNLVYAETWVATYKANYKNTVNGEEGINRNWKEDAQWEEIEDINLGTVHSVSTDPNNDSDYSDIKQEYINEITIEKCTAKVNTLKGTYQTDNILYYLDESEELFNNYITYIYNSVKGASTGVAKNNINGLIEGIWNDYVEGNDEQPSNFEDVEELKRYIYNKLNSIVSNMNTLISAEMDITEYQIKNKSAHSLQTVNTNSYISAGTITKERASIDKDNNFEKYFNKSSRAKEYILQSPDWFFEMLESQEKTANMIDLVKYLLYKSTETSFGITEYNFDMMGTLNFTGLNGTVTGNTIEEKVWFTLKAAGYSDYAVAGVMGNLYGESGLRTNNLENIFAIGGEHSLGYTDESYTEAINNGTYTLEQFISDHTNDNCGAGYGLAQWTYYTRKEGLYKFAKSRGANIDDPDIQVEYLLGEISPSGGADGFATYQLGGTVKGYSYDNWANAKSVDEATMAFMLVFERPASYTYNSTRCNKAQEYYNKFQGKVLSGGEYVSEENNGIIGHFTSNITGRKFTIYNQMTILPDEKWSGDCNRAVACSIASAYDNTNDDMTVIYDAEYEQPGVLYIQSTSENFFNKYGLGVSINKYHYSVDNIRTLLTQGKYVAIHILGETGGGNSATGKSGANYTNYMHWIGIIGYRVEGGKEQIFISDPGWGQSGWKDIDEFDPCIIDAFTVVYEKE